MMDFSDLSPAYVRSIAPYQPGKPIAELAREMGLDEAKIGKLASNANPRARGARSIVTPAKDYGHDLEAMAAAVDADTQVVWIANPNNPTGTIVSPERLGAVGRGGPARRPGVVGPGGSRNTH